VENRNVLKLSSGCYQHQLDTNNLYTFSHGASVLSVPFDIPDIQRWLVAPRNGYGLRSLCGTNWIFTKERCFPVNMHCPCRFMATEKWVRWRANQCGICGVGNRSGPGFSPSPSFFPLSVSFPHLSALFDLTYLNQKVKRTRPGNLKAKISAFFHVFETTGKRIYSRRFTSAFSTILGGQISRWLLSIQNICVVTKLRFL